MVQGPCGHVLQVGETDSEADYRGQSRGWWSTEEGCPALLGSSRKGFIQRIVLSWFSKDEEVFIHKAKKDTFLLEGTKEQK